MMNPRFYLRWFLFVTAALSNDYLNAGTVIKAETGTDLALGTSWFDGSEPTSNDVATWSASSLGADLTIGNNDVNWGSIVITGAATNISIAGSGKINTGNISLSGDKTLTIASDIALSDNSIYNIGDVIVDIGEVIDDEGHVTSLEVVDATLSGKISGSGFGIIKSGSGTLTLSGSNTYTGSTTVNAGTLKIRDARSLGSGLVTVTDGTLDLGNYASGNTIALNGGKLTSMLGSSSGHIGTVNIGGNSAITGSFSTIDTGTNKNVEINTAGDLEVAVLNGQGSFSNGLVSVSDTHNPGNSQGNSLGTQIFNAGLTYGAWSTVNLEIDSLGRDCDSIVVGGALTYDLEVTVNISMSGEAADYTSEFWNSSHSFELFSFDTLSLDDGFGLWNLENLGSDPAEGSWGLVQDSNSISAVWTAIPEPGAAWLGGLGLLALLRRRRGY